MYGILMCYGFITIHMALTCQSKSGIPAECPVQHIDSNMLAAIGGILVYLDALPLVYRIWIIAITDIGLVYLQRHSLSRFCHQSNFIESR